MTADGLSRGVPAQHRLENQDPDVMYVVDEVTRERKPLSAPEKVVAAPKGKKSAASAKFSKPAKSVAEEAPSVSQGAGE